jgi:hypothetical protein
MNQNNLPEKSPSKRTKDLLGQTHEQAVARLRQMNGEGWYQQNRVRLENPEVWEQYLSLN